MTSILTSVKKMLGIEDDYTHFDPDIIININAVLMGLTQIGVGPTGGFLITGKDETWADLLGTRIDLEGVKTFVYLKVRMLFDQPASSFVLDAMQRQATEIEWRLNMQAENIEVGDG